LVVGEKMFKKSKEHLEETNWSYWKHLSHSIKQSNRLLVIAFKSYVHGIVPAWYKSDGPVSVYKMYRQISKIHHVQKMFKELDKKD